MGRSGRCHSAATTSWCGRLSTTPRDLTVDRSPSPLLSHSLAGRATYPRVIAAHTVLLSKPRSFDVQRERHRWPRFTFGDLLRDLPHEPLVRPGGGRIEWRVGDLYMSRGEWHRGRVTRRREPWPVARTGRPKRLKWKWLVEPDRPPPMPLIGGLREWERDPGELHRAGLRAREHTPVGFDPSTQQDVDAAFRC